MSAIKFINEETRIFASYLNPHQGLFHDEMQKRLDDTGFKITMAYDGLTL